METWGEMTMRQAQEKAKLERGHEFDRYHLRVKESPDKMEEYILEERIEKESRQMLAKHFSEAKAHPESPNLDPKWEEYFSSKGRLSMDEYTAQRKTEQQKIEEELRASIATNKTVFDQLREREEQQKHNPMRPDFDR